MRIIRGIIYWTMGSFHTSNWNKVFSCLPFITIGILVIYILRWKINILALGYREAKILGVNPERNKIFIIIAATLLGAPFFIVLLRKTRAGGWH